MLKAQCSTVMTRTTKPGVDGSRKGDWVYTGTARKDLTGDLTGFGPSGAGHGEDLTDRQRCGGKLGSGANRRARHGSGRGHGGRGVGTGQGGVQQPELGGRGAKSRALMQTAIRGHCSFITVSAATRLENTCVKK